MGDSNIDQEAIVKTVIEDVEKVSQEKARREREVREQEERQKAEIEKIAIERALLQQTIDIHQEDAGRYMGKAMKKFFLLALFWVINILCLSKFYGGTDNWSLEALGECIYVTGAVVLLILWFCLFIKLLGLFFGIIGGFGVMMIASGPAINALGKFTISEEELYHKLAMVGIVISAIMIMWIIFDIVRSARERTNGKNVRKQLEGKMNP